MSLTKAGYAACLIPLCELIVGAVHDDGPDELLAALGKARAVKGPPNVAPNDAIITILAAMCDPLKTASESLGWVRGLTEVRVAAVPVSGGQVPEKAAA